MSGCEWGPSAAGNEWKATTEMAARKRRSWKLSRRSGIARKSASSDGLQGRLRELNCHSKMENVAHSHPEPRGDAPTTGHRPSVAVVVLNWNGSEDTVNCVESLLAMPGERPMIVVADNDSRPEQLDVLRTGLRSLVPDCVETTLEDGIQGIGAGSLVLLRTGANLGFAGGNNRGCELALRVHDFDYVWFLNNDTVVEPNALGELLSRAAQDPKIGICGSTLVYLQDKESVQAWGGAAYHAWTAASMSIGHGHKLSDTPSDPTEVEAKLGYVVGASMLVSRRYLREVGFMEESYFLYSEEHDWAQQGIDRFRLGWAPRSIVYHIHGAAIGTDPSGGSPLSMFYLYRNKLRFAWIHTRWALPTVIASVSWKIVKELLKGRFRTAKAMTLGILAFPSMRPFPASRFSPRPSH